MAAKMSSRQRYLTTFKHEEPDRVPIFLDTGPICFYTDKIRWESQLQQAEILLEAGCDPMINLWYPTPVPNPDVEIKTWREKRPTARFISAKSFIRQKVSCVRLLTKPATGVILNIVSGYSRHWHRN